MQRCVMVRGRPRYFVMRSVFATAAKGRSRGQTRVARRWERSSQAANPKGPDERMSLATDSRARFAVRAM